MRVGVLGAGAIGRYLAVRLSAAGVPTVLLGRRADDDFSGLAAVDVAGRRTFPAADLVATSDPEALCQVALCIVAVKSRGTEVAAATLAGVLSPETPVVSLQNGLRNVDTLRRTLGSRAVGGVVGYNVYRRGAAVYQASAGQLVTGMLPGIGGYRLRRLRALFRDAGEALVLREDIEQVLAGKLLLNLNNGICAATGLSISESLAVRDARWCFAQCLHEGLAVMRSAGTRPARVTILPPQLIGYLLALPDSLVLRAARALVAVDAEARSSTLQDLDRQRPTEIDELNGAIGWLARRAGTAAPVNDAVTEVVHEHERVAREGVTPAYLPPSELRARLERAMKA